MPVINTNLKALDSQEAMRTSNLAMSQAMERLSTGKKINSAKDDAAGLAISNRMTAQIRGIAKAIQNSNDAISMTQTAEGALGNVGDILQRMRELAVQAVSGTNNASDRASLQLEVSQLKAQIDDIAKKTNHNNIKLLDGSAQNLTMQTGVNSGDTVKVGFGSVQTKDIGIGSRSSLSSAGGAYSSGAAFDALSAGALFLNGVAVGASLASDDNLSSANQSASAIAKAAAINKVAAISGVYAKAGVTTLSGTAMTLAASTQGYVTINGVNTDTFSTSGTSTALSRKAVVNAINAKTAITGVVATDTESDEGGVALTAADGRNIVVDATTGGMTSAGMGLQAVTSQVGSYSLYTLDGRDINVSFSDGDNDVEAFSGLRNGTYSSDTAIYSSYKRTTTLAAAAPTSALQGLLNANSMVINGVAIGQALSTDDTASIDTALSSSRAASAIAIAAAINKKSDLTGVTAKAAANVIRGEGFTALASTVSSAKVYLNGVAITANTQSRAGVIDSINQYSGQTGVVASAFGDGIQYSAADGRNITIGSSAGAAALGLSGITIGTAETSALSVTYYSQVQLSSSNAFKVQAGTNGVLNLEKLGFREGTYGGTDNGLKINQLDVSTASGASQAITAVDAAINTVSAQQANAGAINNRLDVIINNLSEYNQNIQASRSRILDTDYATETTNLAKQQIISQASTAMLAQANQSSQSILSLLK
jgi:flagellin